MSTKRQEKRYQKGIEKLKAEIKEATDEAKKIRLLALLDAKVARGFDPNLVIKKEKVKKVKEEKENKEKERVFDKKKDKGVKNFKALAKTLEKKAAPSVNSVSAEEIERKFLDLLEKHQSVNKRVTRLELDLAKVTRGNVGAEKRVEKEYKKVSAIKSEIKPVLKAFKGDEYTKTLLAEITGSIVRGDGNCVQIAWDNFSSTKLFASRPYELAEIIEILSAHDYGVVINRNGLSIPVLYREPCVSININEECDHLESFSFVQSQFKLLKGDFCVTRLFKLLKIEVPNKIYKAEDLEELAETLERAIMLTNTNRERVLFGKANGRPIYYINVSNNGRHAISIGTNDIVPTITKTINLKTLALASRSVLDSFKERIENNKTDMLLKMKDSANYELLKASSLYMQSANPYDYTQNEMRLPDGQAGSVAVVDQAAVLDVIPLVGNYGCYVGALISGGITDMGYLLDYPPVNSWVISSYGPLGNSGVANQVKQSSDWTHINDKGFTGTIPVTDNNASPFLLPIGTGFSSIETGSSMVVTSNIYSNGHLVTALLNPNNYDYTLFKSNNGHPVGMYLGNQAEICINVGFDMQNWTEDYSYSSVIILRACVYTAVGGTVTQSTLTCTNTVTQEDGSTVSFPLNTYTYDVVFNGFADGSVLLGISIGLEHGSPPTGGTLTATVRSSLVELKRNNGDNNWEIAPYSYWTGFASPDAVEISSFANEHRVIAKSLLFSDGTSELIAGGFVSAAIVNSMEYPTECFLTSPKNLAESAIGLNHKMPLGVYVAPCCFSNIRARAFRDIDAIFNPAQPYGMLMANLPLPTSGQYVFRAIFAEIIEITSKNSRFIKQFAEPQDDLVLQTIINVFAQQPILGTNGFHWSDILSGLNKVGMTVATHLPMAIDMASNINQMMGGNPRIAAALGIARPIGQLAADMVNRGELKRAEDQYPGFKEINHNVQN
jgi:hypothetical protein